jgi:hypothetical protein
MQKTMADMQVPGQTRDLYQNSARGKELYHQGFVFTVNNSFRLNVHYSFGFTR